MRRYFRILAAVLALTIGAVGLQPAEATWGTSSWRTVKTFSGGCKVEYRHTQWYDTTLQRKHLGSQVRFTNCYSGNPITIERFIQVIPPGGSPYWAQQAIWGPYALPSSPNPYTTGTDSLIFNYQTQIDNARFRWCGSYGCFPIIGFYYAH